MEEEDEEKKEGKVKQVLKEQAKQRAKQEIINGVKKTTKEGAKKIWAAVLKDPRVLLVIAIIIAAIILLAAIVKLVVVLNGSYDEDVKGNVPATVESMINEELGSNLKIKQDGSGYDIDIDAFVDKVIQKLYENESVLPTYIKKYNQKEYLANFIKAELETRNLKIGDADPTKNGEFNGVIKVKRKAIDDSSEEGRDLVYTDLSNLEAYIDAKDEKALDYFSVNSAGQLVVAKYTQIITEVDSDVPGIPDSRTEEIEYSETVMDYKSVLDGFSMPFDFIWALLVKSTDEEFANEVAKLAVNTEINLTVFDNLTTTVEKITTAYTVTVTTTDSTTGQTSSQPETRYVITTITTNTNNVEVNATYADAWMAKYTIKYNQKHTPLTLMSNTQFTFGEDEPEEQVEATASGVTTRKRDSENYEIWLETKVYEGGPPNVEEKVDPNASENNFVKLLNKYVYAQLNIMKEPTWLFEMLKTSRKSSEMIDLLKYLLYKATGVNFGVTSMENLLVSEMIPTKTTGMDYIVDTQQSSEQTIITEFDELRKVLATYNTELTQYTQQFLNIQTKYHVNAIFAAAVAVQETGGGTTGNATNDSNNWYNIKGKNTTWAQYGSVEECIDAFGRLINKDYFSENRITVSSIGKAYCPNTDADPTAAETWTRSIVAQMTYFYKVLGVTISGNDMISDDIQSNIMQIAQNSSAYGIVAVKNHCLGWVRDVYIKAGAPYYASCCCARHAGYYYGVSTDMNIPIGALVFGHSRTTNGILYGHVGIYIGNNTVAHNVGSVTTTSLADWMNQYPYVGWGWCSTKPVLAQYPVNKGALAELMNTAHTEKISVSPQ